MPIQLYRCPKEAKLLRPTNPHWQVPELLDRIQQNGRLRQESKMTQDQHEDAYLSAAKAECLAKVYCVPDPFLAQSFCIGSLKNARRRAQRNSLPKAALHITSANSDSTGDLS
jgi:hypothetical protein